MSENKKDLDRTFLGLQQECLSCHIDEHRGQLNQDCQNCHNFDAWSPTPLFNHDQTRFQLTGKHTIVKCEKCHITIIDDKFTDDNSYKKFTGLNFATCKNCHEDVHKNRFGPGCKNCHNTNGWQNYAKDKFNHENTRFALIGKHRRVSCESCHIPGRPLKIAKFQKCTDCHKDYHQGQFANRPKKETCDECHTEEGFIPAQFTILQHEQTNYPLKGSHLAVPCFLCHRSINPGTGRETKQFRFQSTQCAACHVDPHQGEVDKYLKLRSEIGKSDGCEHCHVVESWSQVNFDHTLTNFKLEGKHRTIDCNACHVKFAPNQEQHFNKIPNDCQQCHPDIHGGQFITSNSINKTQCQRCHTPVNWASLKFIHDQDSRFEITGAHEKVPCQNCHKIVKLEGQRIVRYKPMEISCNACHGVEKNGGKK